MPVSGQCRSIKQQVYRCGLSIPVAYQANISFCQIDFTVDVARRLRNAIC
jgi:hypothetical protein